MLVLVLVPVLVVALGVVQLAVADLLMQLRRLFLGRVQLLGLVGQRRGNGNASRLFQCWRFIKTEFRNGFPFSASGSRLAPRAMLFRHLLQETAQQRLRVDLDAVRVEFGFLAEIRLLRVQFRSRRHVQRPGAIGPSTTRFPFRFGKLVEFHDATPAPPLECWSGMRFRNGIALLADFFRQSAKFDFHIQ